jgi:hypothetical protein
MTEADWLTATDPRPMLTQLMGKASERRVRLLRVAAARSIWPEFTDQQFQTTIEFAERYADGNGTGDELNAYRDAMYGIYIPGHPRHRDQIPPAHLSALAFAAVSSHPLLLMLDGGANWIAAVNHLGCVLPDIIHCIFGNPFRPVAFDPAWRTETVVALATAIYAERAFDRMPILADALQEVGCDNDDILTHCRGDSPHARGCWVVDLVLSKS